VNHDLQPIGPHLVDEIQGLIYHLLPDEQGDGQIEQTEH